jgi:hypothetical protein
MADKSGFYPEAVIGLYSTEYLSSDTYSGGVKSNNTGASVMSTNPGSNTMTDMSPVEVVSGPFSGFSSNYYYKDYYGRVHIYPANINIGNLLSTVTTTFRIWNANTSSKAVGAITYTGTEGISVTSSKTLPGTFAAMEEVAFTIQATLDGPPTLDATIHYDFDSSTNDVELKLTGQRVVVWPFMPQTNVSERLQWSTNVLNSYDKEQRVSLRIAPRQSLEYEFICDPQQFSRMKTASAEWSHRLYGVPVWYDAVSSASVSSGASVLNVNTQYSDFVVGGLALVWASDTNNEVVEIVAKTSSTITLKLPLQNGYTTPIVAPVQLGFTPNGVKFSRSPSQTTTAKAVFELTGNTQVSLTFSPTTYKGYYVVTDRILMFGSVEESISRDLDVIDSVTGTIELDTLSNKVRRRGSVTAFARTAQDRWKTRSWFHYLRGKQKAFWISTWNTDMELSTLMTNSSYSMEIKNIGFTLFVGTGDVVVRMKSGTVYYNRILGAEVLTDGTERLAMENLFPIDLDPAQVEAISMLHLVRLDSDDVEFSYNSGAMEVSLPTMGVTG